MSRPLQGVAAFALVLVSWLGAFGQVPGSGPASLPGQRGTMAVAQATTAPAATEPAAPATTRIAVVNWNSDFDAAAAEAKRRNVLAVMVYFDPDSPTCQAFEEQSLSALAVRQYLADFAGARINVTTPGGRKRFAATGAAEPPVTQVYSPAGELLDSLPGALVPEKAFRQALERSVKYWQAAEGAQASPQARWRAAVARLLLSTRSKAASDIDLLLRLPSEQLPSGLTPARLQVAKGTALYLSAPPLAEEAFQQARKLTPNDPASAGKALVQLGNLATAARKYQQAHSYYAEYIAAFPQGPDIGEAYCDKAMLEMLPLDDRAEAKKTLSEFISKYPDDFLVVRAKELLSLASQTTTAKGKP